MIEELTASDTVPQEIETRRQSIAGFRSVFSGTPRASRFASESPYSTPHKEPDDPSWPTRQVSFTSQLGALEDRVPRFPIINTSPRRNVSRVVSSKIDDHIYTRGFLEGACSDIQIQAFEKTFSLHRIILDRSPFFSMMFSGPWRDSDSRSMELKFDDSNITCTAFDFALARLYGKQGELDSIDCLSLLATAAYLDMSELQEQCTNWLLRHLTAESITAVVKFVTGKSTYGIHSDRIREAAKALLYRDAYDMTPEELIDIPGEMLAEVIASDGFFCPSEIDRYNYLIESISYRKKHVEDVEMLEEVLKYGIHYMHMSQTELKKIMKDGLVDENILYKALWNQVELKEEIEEAISPILGTTQTEETDYPVPFDDTCYIGDPLLSPPVLASPPEAPSYSIFPPFRFSAEFERISDLKEDTRVYSHTVFYAGSYWNIYIHNKVRARKSRQLGVYLHRVEIKGQMSPGEALSSSPRSQGELSAPSTSPDAKDAHGIPLGAIAEAKRPYVDQRSTISTYFKIYCPSRKGTSKVGVTEFRSAPDEFHRSQSWGWKSRGLCAYDEREVIEGEGSGEIAGLKFMVVLGVV
ncbi:Putative uncharacterized protein [Taphrina deformans PYCC 5710]|uniref:BTB domain-containing protein n=1 Tax=Taphrina deformans (strain PYCC 5710 / ATCC 11124 / CBS 356.35 / IMI 108563 / JCM 9778 / NBRC 8474) TaxID=1097556 RepID=R4XAQ5_TAPDE|nr:Putative uncharacterized protein [Taphrina deformans PYCC 5710]|eukprot:CCG82934.1 Putative uncharacterized protein [Taphrina deformans PYCC 5710]